MMDTVLNLGLNDQTVLGLAKLSGDRASPMTAIAASSRCTPTWCWASATTFEEILDDHKDRSSASPRHRPHRRRLEAVVVAYKKLVEKRTGKPFPQDPRSSSGARSARCSAAG
jgi:pyruvate,orthophosphate dikinase